MTVQLDTNKIAYPALNASVTQVVLLTKDMDVEAAAYFDYNVNNGVTVNISVSTSDSSIPSTMVWTLPAALTGLVGSAGSTRGRYNSSTFTGIKIDRVSGAATVDIVTSSNAVSAAGSTTNPSSIQGNTAGGTTDSGNPVKVGGVFNTVRPTYTDAQRTDIQTNSNGVLYVQELYQDTFPDNVRNVAKTVELLMAGDNTYSPNAPYTNFGAAVTQNVKSTSANIYGIYATNANAAVRYIQIHNTATTPAGGAVPVMSFAIPALGGDKVIDHAFLVGAGVNLATGAAMAVSTTAGTYTAATAAEHNTIIIYK